MGKLTLGSRMKEYENANKAFLTKRMPIIIRIDGRAFHSFTRGFKKPFDNYLMGCMWQTAQDLCANIEGCKIAYTQSDEISLFLNNYESLETSAWFNNNIQKIASISASMATLYFNNAFNEMCKNMNDGVIYKRKLGTAMFDARAFVLPKEEVCNYFIWRQQDAMRNSVQMVGQANFSHKQLQGKNCENIKNMLKDIGVDYDNFTPCQKYGACIIKERYEIDNGVIRNRWITDLETPIFTENREYIEKYI